MGELIHQVRQGCPAWKTDFGSKPELASQTLNQPSSLLPLDMSVSVWDVQKRFGDPG